MTTRKNSWTEEELQILKDNWGKSPVDQVAALLSRHTKAACSNKAYNLDLSVRKRKKLDTGGVEEPSELVRAINPPTPAAAEVPPAMVRLAQFDPVIRRALEDRLAGRGRSPEPLPFGPTRGIARYG